MLFSGELYMMDNLDIPSEEASGGKISSLDSVSTLGKLKRKEEDRQGAPLGN